MWGTHNFHHIAVYSVILFSALILLLSFLTFYNKSEKSFTFQLLYAIILLEFFCNAFISTNQNFIPASRSTQSIFILSTDRSEQPASSATSTTLISDEYKQFAEETSASDIYELINILSESVTLDDKDLITYNGNSLLNNFEYSNALCHKLGYTEDLFLPAPDIEIHFAENEEYVITPISNGLYNIQFKNLTETSDKCYIPFTLSTSGEFTQELFFYDDYTEHLLSLKPEFLNSGKTCYMAIYPPYLSINLQAMTYTINSNVKDTLAETIHTYLESHNSSSSLVGLSDYMGIVVSSLGAFAFLILFFNSDKEKVYAQLQKIKKNLSDWKFTKRIAKHLINNYIYYLAFLIPCIFFIMTMIIFDCVPFGQNSFYDGDGLCLTLPANIDTYYNLQEGNTYFDIYGGYGNNLYAWNPLLLSSYIMTLLSPSQIAPFLLFMEAICLGLSGFNIVFYLTHRLNSKQANKKDFRLLIPALVYSLNTYMLAMHGFTSWYYTLMAFPLVMLCMDYLVYRNKTLPYVITLAFCIITTLSHGLYICIFLLIILRNTVLLINMWISH